MNKPTKALTMPSDPLAILSMQNLDQRVARKAQEKQEKERRQAETASLENASQETASAPPDTAGDSGQHEDQVLVNQQVNKLTDQQSNELSNKPDNVLTNRPDNLLDGQLINNLTSARTNPQVAAPAVPTVQDPAAAFPTDPLSAAYLQAISLPYPNMDKSPRVLVAGRVRQEVNERFEHVCALLKKKGDKQDVLDKALRVFIDHVLERQGDVEL
jgi:hypothetical protein